MTSPLTSRRFLRTGALLSALAATALGLMSPVPADAHSALVSSSPAAGSTVAAAPTSIVLNFDEAVQELSKSAISVSSPTGAEMVDGSIKIAGPVVQASLAPFTDEGAYTVTFRIVSADGHEVNDTFAFNFFKSASAADASSGAAAPGDSPSAAADSANDSPSDAPATLGSGQNGLESATPMAASAIASAPKPQSSTTKWVLFAVFGAALYFGTRFARNYRRRKNAAS